MTIMGAVLWLLSAVASPGAAAVDAETHCTALAVFTEARGESLEGQAAVAQVVLNRERDRNLDACGVVYQRRQFAGVETWAKKRIKPWQAEPKAWRTAIAVSRMVRSGAYRYGACADATHFDMKQLRPSWSRKMRRVCVVANHVFYQGR